MKETENEKNDICNKETEIFSRVTGYHRPLKHWNIGKQQEFKERKAFKFKVKFDDKEPRIENIKE